MDSEPRSRAARDRAEGALAHFGLLAAGHLNEFVIIGGLSPDFLAPAAPVPHSGTTDIDLLFEIGFVYDRDEHDFGWLDRLLEEGGFRSRNSDCWRWDALLGDAKIRLDLLCDVPDNPGQAIALPGAMNAATKNFTGPAPALIAPITKGDRIAARCARGDSRRTSRRFPAIFESRRLPAGKGHRCAQPWASEGSATRRVLVHPSSKLCRAAPTRQPQALWPSPAA